ncbi:MAG: hypothetical protein JJU45_00535 [Acidimicrobiia bacterium]|nr:hypothetical protein [Acidimicrobiia bacterium]
MWAAPSIVGVRAVAAQTPQCEDSEIDWADTTVFEQGDPKSGGRISPIASDFPWTVGDFGGTTVEMAFVSGTHVYYGGSFTPNIVTPPSVGAAPGATTGGQLGYFRFTRRQDPSGTPNVPAGTEAVLRISFSNLVENLTFSLLDVDNATSGGNFEDIVEVTAFDTVNGLGPLTYAWAAPGASPSFTPNAGGNGNGSTSTGQIFTGNGDAPDTSNNGNIDYTVAGPVNEINIRYEAGVDARGQHIGVSDLAWTCP